MFNMAAHASFEHIEGNIQSNTQTDKIKLYLDKILDETVVKLMFLQYKIKFV